MSNIFDFKYKIIKNFFLPDELALCQRQCDEKLKHKGGGNGKDYGYELDDMTNCPSWNQDPLMYKLLEEKQSLVEKETLLKLTPTYAYWRYYIDGGFLHRHTDRPACEISATACIKKLDDWPLIIGDKTIELEEGEAIIYLGCVIHHSRPGIYKGRGLAQVFFHYVEKHGIFHHHSYDDYYLKTGDKEAYGDNEIINIEIEKLKNSDI